MPYSNQKCFRIKCGCVDVLWSKLRVQLNLPLYKILITYSDAKTTTNLQIHERNCICVTQTMVNKYK